MFNNLNLFYEIIINEFYFSKNKAETHIQRDPVSKGQSGQRITNRKPDSLNICLSTVYSQPKNNKTKSHLPHLQTKILRLVRQCAEFLEKYHRWLEVYWWPFLFEEESSWRTMDWLEDERVEVAIKGAKNQRVHI